VKTLRCIGLKNDGSRCTREKEFDDDQAPKEWRCWQHPIEKNKDSSLTEKQKAFADEYIISMNATDAAIKAGYSENSAYSIGNENLKKPEIKNYIEKRLEEKEEARVATQDEVLEYLTKVMRGEVEEETVVTENIGDYMSEARVVSKKVGPKDRNKAAELLGKRYSLFKDNLDIDLQGGIQIIDDIE
jgi:phage terminase small subunit